jgi:3',5'-cyclic AMP phosphodiesterase CpdA
LATAEADAFSLVILPDTQKYVETASLLGRFTAQTQWIADNKDWLNIAFVLHSGDIVENSDRDVEWSRAEQALSVLDGKVPYILAVGNHDLEGPSTFNKTRATRAYNRYFPAGKFERQPWYGGRQAPHENDNYYVLFEHRHLKFMVISLKFAPPDDVLSWANQIVAAHPDRRAIVLTHCYLDTSNERGGRSGLTNPHNFNLPEVNDGEQIWDKFASRHPNIFLVVSGHYHGVGRLTSVGVHGNKVHQVLADYQSWRLHGRDGWMRIMQFSPGQNVICVKTFSPYLNEWLTDADNEFVLPYDMHAPDGLQNESDQVTFTPR